MIEQRDGEQSQLNSPVGRKHSNHAQRHVYDNANWVFGPEGVQVGRALDPGIDDVSEKGSRQKAEEPSTA